MAGRLKITSPTLVRRGQLTTRNFCRRVGVPAAMAVEVDGRPTLIEVAGLEIGVTIQNDRKIIGAMGKDQGQIAG